MDTSQVEFPHQSPGEEDDNGLVRCCWIHSDDYLACISLSFFLDSSFFLCLLLMDQVECFKKVVVLS